MKRTSRPGKHVSVGRQAQGALAEIKCQVLLMLDACHSAWGFGQGQKLAQMGPQRPRMTDARLDAGDDYAVAVMWRPWRMKQAEGRDGLACSAWPDSMRGEDTHSGGCRQSL